MKKKKVNPIIRWWVTPKLPIEDIFELPLLIDKSFLAKVSFLFSRWLIHPIKRRFAKWYLKLLQNLTDIKIIAVTGSAGKSTTVQMIASILKRSGSVIATPPSIDPIYNVPNTILRISPWTKYLILEMSVEYPGEMDYYLWLAKPDLGVITNIFPTHTEFLGDVGGVLKEKSKLVLNLPKDGVAVLNGQDRQLLKLKGKLKSKEILFGDGTKVMGSQEHVNSENQTEFLLIFNQDPKKRVKVKIPAIGHQYVSNALAASAVTHTLGISIDDIKRGLETFSQAKHRMEIIKHKSGAIIFDDSYNSNPKAAEESIETFSSVAWKKERVIVFGDMLELGNWDKKYHMELGYILGKAHPSMLICVGLSSMVTAAEAAKILGQVRVISVLTWQDAYEKVKPYLQKGVAILVKGSRSIGLDKLVAKLV